MLSMRHGVRKSCCPCITVSAIATVAVNTLSSRVSRFEWVLFVANLVNTSAAVVVPWAVIHYTQCLFLVESIQAPAACYGGLLQGWIKCCFYLHLPCAQDGYSKGVRHVAPYAFSATVLFGTWICQSKQPRCREVCDGSAREWKD
eukprot:527791-Pelagomonas_calceolata.AAC.10